MNKKFLFLSGLPRSGSTVLSALLKQHPESYVSPTSPLVELLSTTERAWSRLDQKFTMPFPHHLESLSYFMIYGFYESIDKEYIFDKSRSWPLFAESLEKVLDQKPKIVSTVRDIPSILASFYRLFHWGQSNPNYIESQLLERGLLNNPENRCQILWESMVKGPWQALQKGLQASPQSILLIEYDELLKNSSETMRKIYHFCEMPYHQNDFENINTEKEEIDEKWGIEGLHTIAPVLKRKTAAPIEIIGEKAFQKFSDLKLEFWRY